MSTIVVRRVGAGARVSDWIAVPPFVHRDDPHFVRRLDLEERLRVQRWYNPFFKTGEAALFVAFRDGRPVGRISAQIDELHRARHDPGAGHFGFFDCIDDLDVSTALFDAARQWLAERGSTSILGPFSFSINEEAGLLIEGFDDPATMLMNQARPYAGRLVEAAGLVKAIDTLAFRVRPDIDPPHLARYMPSSAQMERIHIRPLRMDRYAEDMALIIDIFNDAWSDNWGFVPWTEAATRALARQLRPIIRPEHLSIVEADGRAVAFFLCLPDENAAIAPYGGRLFPFAWWKILRAMRSPRWRCGRVPLFGIRRDLHRSTSATGIGILMVREILRVARAAGADWVEWSWILETNRPAVASATIAGGPPAKRYRIYRGDMGRFGPST